ncbi:MAG: hypothetical protein AAF311_09105 [Pseudomonadota bacterium]
MTSIRSVFAATALLALSACQTGVSDAGPDATAPPEPSPASIELQKGKRPKGATLSPDGFLTITDAPQPGAQLFVGHAERRARMQGLSAAEVARRTETEQRLMRKREYWWNALLDDEPRTLRGSYMDWTVETSEGLGQEVVILDDPFPMQTLSYYVTDPQVRAAGPDALEALSSRRAAFVQRLEGMGLSVKADPVEWDGSVVIEGNPETLRAEHGADRLDPPAGVRVSYDMGTPDPDPALSALLRVDPVDRDARGPYVQPYNRGHITVRDGCVLVETRSERHLARFMPGQALGVDADGYAALLDGFGGMSVRFGTRIGFSGSSRAVHAPPEDADACGVDTQMWLPEARSETSDGPFNP